MSAVAAILHSHGKPASEAAIGAMTSAMHYRGPDGIRHHVSDNCALGHCAMHCTAEDRDAALPLLSADGRFTIVFDGYLANYADLRRDLLQRGAILRSRSDAELVLAAYGQWQDACLDHIEGEFAFVIHDLGDKTLFCACDHTGLRQLYYHWDGKTFVAATDIVGVLAALPEKSEPNLGYLAQHIANGWFTRDETAWQGVMRLPQAHCIVVGDSGPSVQQYWHLPTQVSQSFKSDNQFIERYREVLEECIASSARSDAPLACEVSGGLDSSAVFGLLDLMDKTGSLPAPGLRGFTLSAPDGTPADEARFVRAMERETGRDIQPVALFCPDLDWFAQQGRQDARLPFLPNTVMLRGMLEAAAQSGCRVNLTGQGGDQWLDGLPHYYRQSLRSGDWRGFARSCSADWQARGAGWTVKQALKQSLLALTPDAIRSARQARRDGRGPVASGADLLSPQMQEMLAEQAARYSASLTATPPDDRAKIGKLAFPFNLLVFEMLDLQSARVGIETRHPMLSKKFATFSATTPEHFKLRGGVTKFAHRQAVRDVLPGEIVERQSKAHFSQTFAPYFDEMRQFCKNSVRENKSFQSLTDTRAVNELFATPHACKIDEIPIWSLWGLYAVTDFLAAAREKT